KDIDSCAFALRRGKICVNERIFAAKGGFRNNSLPWTFKLGSPLAENARKLASKFPNKLETPG
ncbi:hypothetical protein, partial [Asticcacaulis benevestitus]|uniref:hypothetical protein n=1 Tax=Asticcacaulis benevestitus TaxID=347481 RepID=UPI000551C4EA